MRQRLNQVLNEKTNLPLIILIGGVFGVGKTSLSYNLSQALDIKQRASLGVITKTLRYLDIFPKTERLFELLEENDIEFTIFDKRSKQVCRIANYIIREARNDGVNYILDGVQLLPKYLDFQENTLFIYLKAPSEKELLSRLNSSTTHSKRYKQVTLKNVKRIIDLDKHLLSSLKIESNAIIVDSSLNEKQILKLVLKSFKK